MRRGPLLLGFVAAALFGQNQPPGDPLDTLVRDSPFLPPAGGIRAASAGESGPLELRGVVFERGAYSFSVYDQTTREAVWVRLGESGHPFVARSFDQEGDALTVEHRGRSVVLVLEPAKTMTGDPGAAPPPPLPTAAEAAPPGANQPTPAANPPPAAAVNPAEAQRLQNVADEVRRRRGAGSHPTQ